MSQTAISTKTTMQRFLDFIEKVGNKVPHPVVIFLILIAIVIVLSGVLGEPAEFKTFFHGHTYTGNALACAAAIASLELFEENKIIESLPAKIDLIADYLKKISVLDYVGDVRQCGLMTGIEIVKDKKTKESFSYEKLIGVKICAAMRQKGAMMRPLSDVIVLMPPVAIDLPLLRQLLDIVYDAIKNDLPKIIRLHCSH